MLSTYLKGGKQTKKNCKVRSFGLMAFFSKNGNKIIIIIIIVREQKQIKKFLNNRISQSTLAHIVCTVTRFRTNTPAYTHWRKRRVLARTGNEKKEKLNTRQCWKLALLNDTLKESKINVQEVTNRNMRKKKKKKRVAVFSSNPLLPQTWIDTHRNHVIFYNTHWMIKRRNGQK